MHKRSGLLVVLLCLVGLSVGALLGQPPPMIRYLCGTTIFCPQQAQGISDSTGQTVTCNLYWGRSFRVCYFTNNVNDQCPYQLWYCEGTYGILGNTCKSYFSGCP